MDSLDKSIKSLRKLYGIEETKKCTDAKKYMMTIKEVSETTGFSYSTILNRIKSGHLKYFKTLGGKTKIYISDYEDWLKREYTKVEPKK